MTPELDELTGAAVLYVRSRKHGTFRVLIDVEDWPRVSQHTWSLIQAKRGVYFCTKLKGSERHLYLHRFIMNAPAGFDVDHRHHDYCDLRKSELRIATRSQNLANMRKMPGTSRFKGVCMNQGKWTARIGQKRKHLGQRPGTPEGEIACAKLYDRAAREHYGEFALVNFA